MKKTFSTFALKNFALLLFACFAFLACKKEGTGGKAKIYGVVAHHGVPIPNAMVYIKYGAKESPGTNVSVYNNEYKCDSEGNFTFTSLTAGDYFLYAAGYDVNAFGVTELVKGGMYVNITRKENKQQDLAVSE